MEFLKDASSPSNALIDNGYGWKHFKAYAFSQKLRAENDFFRSTGILQERFRLIGVHGKRLRDGVLCWC